MKSGDEITGVSGRTYTVIQRKGSRVLLGFEAAQGTQFIIAHRPYAVSSSQYTWDTDVYFSGDILRAARFLEQCAGGFHGTRNRNFE